jgi:ABC-type nitrate/sulfonate/bicarbonate transport system substrate-binding protein
MIGHGRGWRTAALALTAFTWLGVAAAEAQTKVTVIVFQGLQNLPIFAAQENGFFRKRGIEVDLKMTPNSIELRDGLAQGRYQLAHSAVDNAVALTEMAHVDVVVLLGGDNSFNNLYVQPEIQSYADLRGKVLAVDALDTAYAFQLYEMLKRNGVPPGQYTPRAVGGTPLRLKAMLEDKPNGAAAMLNPPFSIVAEKSGLKRMANAADALGAYQGSSAFALRTWAPGNAETIVHYIQGYVDGLRWALDPANRETATGYLRDKLTLSPEIAAAAYAVAADPRTGMAKDAKVDMQGFRNVLKLRAELHGDWGGTPPAPEKYLDLTYYDKAIANM